MNIYDITLTIVILLTFVFLFLAPLLSTGIQNIRNNWVNYRCNPMVIPFAGLFGYDPTTTFNHCIHSMLKDFMGFLMVPIHQVLNIIGNLGGGFTTAINDVRKIMSVIRNFITEIIQSIFGVFLNILVEIQRMIIKTLDMVGKMVGILTTLLFMVDGTMQTMQSAWNGPPGQLVRALCFSPLTKIKLQDGSLKEMKDLSLGDILKNGEIVEGVIQLKNTDEDGSIREKYYTLPNGESGEPIYVTGSHMIFNGKEYIPVKEHPESKETERSDPVLYCLRTSKHHLPIGDYLFWDWDDDNLVK